MSLILFHPECIVILSAAWVQRVKRNSGDRNSCSLAMTKSVAVSRNAAKKVIKKSKDNNPLVDVPATVRDPRQLRMTNILSGLRHLKAPVVSDLQVGNVGVIKC